MYCIYNEWLNHIYTFLTKKIVNYIQHRSNPFYVTRQHNTSSIRLGLTLPNTTVPAFKEIVVLWTPAQFTVYGVTVMS